jgi:hypothetical protein
MTVMLLPNRIGPTQVTYRPARDILEKIAKLRNSGTT